MEASWLPLDKSPASVLILAAFAMGGVAELFWQHRDWGKNVPRRWATNFGLAIAGEVLVKVLFRTSAVALAYGAGGRHPFWTHPLGIAATVLGVDLLHYLQHRLLHAAAPLWRIHQIHHADDAYDVSTGFRFHPLETLFAGGTYLLAILLVGPAPLGVLIGEAWSSVADILEHMNLRMPTQLDRAVRRILVTPNMHRLHHSTDYQEQQSNFGTIFSFWDRLGGTYLDRQEPQTVGLTDLEPARLGFWPMLLEPFRRAKTVPE